MLEYQRLGHACRGGNLPRRRAAEAVLGEDAAGGVDQGPAALGEAEPDLGTWVAEAASDGRDKADERCMMKGRSGRSKCLLTYLIREPSAR